MGAAQPAAHVVRRASCKVKFELEESTADVYAISPSLSRA